MSPWQQHQVAGNHTARSVTFPWAGTTRAEAAGPVLLVTRGTAWAQTPTLERPVPSVKGRDMPSGDQGSFYGSKPALAVPRQVL